MAKKRNSMQAAAAELVAAVAEQTAAAPDDLDELDEELTADVLEGLRRLDQGGNRVTWYVYCDSPMEREGFVEKLKTEQLDEQRFKGKYGPGEYRVIGKQSDGQYVKGSHKTIKISPILAEDSRDSGGGDALALVREMRESDEKRQAQRAEQLKTYATILAAPLATLGAALIARRPAVDVAALITALRPQQSTLAEMTSALVNLKAMQGEGNNGVDVVLKVLERLPDLPQGGGGDVGWLGFIRDVIKEAAPHARELLGQMAARAPAAAGGGLLPAASTAGPPFGPSVTPAPAPQLARPAVTANGASPPSTPTPSGEPDMLAIIEPWLRRRAADVQEWSSANMDCELCAEMLLASVPKTFRSFVTTAELIALLESADWWERVVAFHPPLQPYHAWVDDLRMEVIDQLRDEGAADPDPKPEAAP